VLIDVANDNSVFDRSVANVCTTIVAKQWCW
jgi:hypothetical protein